jgi:hypothetical protein
VWVGFFGGVMFFARLWGQTRFLAFGARETGAGAPWAARRFLSRAGYWPAGLDTFAF